MNAKAIALWEQIQPYLFGLVGSVALLNGIVAVLAFFKDVLLATYFGTSVQADALTLAYFIPDTLGTNLLGAAMGVSCVPVFSKFFARGELNLLWRSVRSISVVSAMLAFVLTFGLYLFSNQVTYFLTGSQNSELGSTMIPLLYIILPVILISPLLYIGFSLLQTVGSFKIPAGSWVVLHILLILMTMSCMMLRVSIEHAVYGISAAITTGMIAMTLLTWKTVFNRTKFTMRGTFINWLQVDLLEIWRIFIPYLIILFSSQIVYFVERKLAASFDIGTVAGLNYAFRLSQFPIWVFVAAVSSVVLPSMSQDIALGRKDQLKITVSRALMNIWIVTIPTTLLFYFLRVPIVSVLFQRGAFNEHSVLITANLLEGYSLTIIGLSLSAVCLRYFLAASRTFVPLIVFTLSSVLNIAVDYILKYSMGAEGLGYGAAVGAAVNGILLFVVLSKGLKLSYRMSLHQLGKILIANTLPLTIVLIGARAWSFIPAYASFLVRFGFLFAVVGICAGAYWYCLRKLEIIQYSRKEVLPWNHI